MGYGGGGTELVTLAIVTFNQTTYKVLSNKQFQNHYQVPTLEYFKKYFKQI